MAWTSTPGRVQPKSTLMHLNHIKRHKRIGPFTNQVWLLSALLFVVIGVLVLPPIFILIKLSFSDFSTSFIASGFTLDNYLAILADGHFFGILWTTIIFAVFSTLISLFIGTVTAWLTVRTNAPFKGLAYITAIVSLGTPYILYVLAWLFLLGSSGPLNSIYQQITGAPGLLFNVYSLTGMILIEGFLWSPLVFLLMSATFRLANAEMEEAARMNGASILDTIRHISLKLALPAIFALAIFVFIRSMEAFEVPALAGIPGGVKVLTTDIYLSIHQFPPKLGNASAFSVLMLIIVSALLFFYTRIAKQAERYASVTGKGYRPRLFNLGKKRWLGGALIILNFVLLLVLPLLALLWMSLTPYIAPFTMSLIDALSFENYQVVLSTSRYLTLGLNTIIIAFVAATVAMLLTGLSGWLAGRRKPLSGLVDQIATMPLIFPGIVLGVAMLNLSLNMPLPLYGTIWIISIAYVIRYMPYGMRYTYTGVLQLHPELEEAAQCSGASTRQLLSRVVAPLLSPSLMAGWLFIFLIASRELSVAILLAEPSSKVIAVAMFDLWQNGGAGVLSALGLIWTMLMMIIAAGFYLLERRHSGGTFG